MPRTDTLPEAIKPFVFHGVDLQVRGQEALGECPFCYREGKFSVNVETGQWRCFVCAVGSDRGGGNIRTFIRHLHAHAQEATAEWGTLTKNRKLLSPDTLWYWGCVYSPLSQEWIVAGWTLDGKEIGTLYRYSHDPVNKRHRLLATPSLNHHLYGTNLYDRKRETVYICEGPWDGMALWEILQHSDQRDTANVIAVPSCSTWHESWGQLCAGKRVVLLYDNDHPRLIPNTNKYSPPAGSEGMRRVALSLANFADPPRSIHWLAWGDNGYTESLPSGYDVRDWLTDGTSDDSKAGRSNTEIRLDNLSSLMGAIEPIPSDWIGGRSPEAIARGELDIDCKECEDWSTLTSAWSDALEWTQGLDRTLAVMLSCITSTDAVGDQLWVKVIGPPSSGKSVLCEALSVAKRFICAKSVIRGFHSGFHSVNSDGNVEDNSLIAQIKGKTLIIKDGDTLLKQPNVMQILSEARDIYDRVSRTHYRNRIARDYEGYSATVILCGTSAMYGLDASELGERFIDICIGETMDEDMEMRIALRRARQAAKEMSLVADGKMETRDGPDMVLAKQLTGGYVTYLRRNARMLLDRVSEPEAALVACAHMAAFVSFMRARQSKSQEEKAQRELCFRLTSQLVRLAKCLAVVYNEPSLTPKVMATVKQVALDTSSGRTLDIVRFLYGAGDTGLDTKSLSNLTNQLEDKERERLRFLRKIQVVELFKPKLLSGVMAYRWKLTPRIQRLYQIVNSL